MTSRSGETRFATITYPEPGAPRCHFPVTVVRNQAPVTVDKTCAPDPVAKGSSTTCTVIDDQQLDGDATVLVRDKVPSRLSVNAGSVVGGTKPATP